MNMANCPRLIDRRAYWGFGREVHGSGRPIGEMIRERPAPFGWRYLKVYCRNAAVLVPLWLYLPLVAWRVRHWLFFGTLMRLGLWECNEEGGYYVDGYCPFIRCFLTDTDSAQPAWKTLLRKKGYIP